MTMIKSILFKLLSVLFLSLFLFGCDSKITEENFKKIENGMTMEQVKTILGEPSNSNSLGVGGLISGTSATWKDDKTGATIDIQFLNDKVKLSTFKK